MALRVHHPRTVEDDREIARHGAADEATKGTLALNDAQLADILDGKDTPCDPDLRGDMLLLAEGRCIGRGLAKDGLLKNNLPRLMIQQS